MRSSERTLRQQRTPPLHLSRHRMYFSRFQCFLQSQWGHNRSYPLRHHRFSCSRRAYHNQIMTTGGSDLKSSLNIFLPFYIFKIEIKFTLLLIKLFSSIDYSRRQNSLIIKKFDHFTDIPDTINIEIIYDSRLFYIRLRNDEPFKSVFSRLDCNRQSPLYRKNRTVQRQFSHNHIL